MELDLDELRFGGLAKRIANEEYSASFNDDRSGELIKSLYREYQAAGDSKDESTWLHSRLGGLFPFVRRPPRWIESEPMWPFHEGLPMTFIEQVEVGENSTTLSNLVSNVVLYVFGARVIVEDGWEMRYVTVEQRRDLP